MLKNVFLALSLLSLAACGGSDAAATTEPQSEPGAGGATPEPQDGCPPGGYEPVEGPDEIYNDCPVLFEGCCFAEATDACQAAGCGPSCEIMESDPAQVNRCLGG